MCTAFIRRYVGKHVSLGSIVTSAEFLKFGRRNSVDKALSRLVKTGHLVRVARGMFTLPGDQTNGPAIVSVARAKASRFGKQLYEHAAATAASVIGTKPVASSHRYSVNGRTSSFSIAEHQVTLHGSCPRKLDMLPDSAVCRLIKSLWYLGKHALTPTVAENLSAQLTVQEKREFRQAAHLMPGWLWDMFRAWCW